jgi:hypothetical protein
MPAFSGVLWRLSGGLSCIRGLRNVVLNSWCVGCELFYVSFSWKHPLETLHAASPSPYRSTVCPSLIEGYFHETAHPEQSLRVIKSCYRSDVEYPRFKFVSYFRAPQPAFTMSISSTWVHAGCFHCSWRVWAHLEHFRRVSDLVQQRTDME